MADLFRLRAPDNGLEGMIENAEQFVRHLGLIPEKRRQILHPLEVADDDAAGIAKDVRDEENLVPAFVEDDIGLGAGRSVGAFREDAALNSVGILAVNDPINGRGNEDVAFL